ncbi:MAG TPA: M55 family metallopeptidase [Oculatellaceae cyanobacterium]|jgi:D-amino peptidase
MTKLYISADLEGVCGVVTWHQVSPESDRVAYDLAVAQLETEVEAVVEAALDAGVDAVVVNDSHCAMTNLRLAQMHPRVSLISGKPKRCAMSAGLDSSFDGAIYIGYHAKAGARRGVLAHTFHNKLFDVSINGVSYGEGGVNALHASLTFGVPLIMASGDTAFVEEIHTLLPNLPVVETKQGISQTAAKNRPLEELLSDYAEITRTVLKNKAAWKQNLLSVPGPYELRMTFINSLAADTADLIPGLTRVDGRTLAYQADQFELVYRMLQACYSILANTAALE